MNLYPYPYVDTVEAARKEEIKGIKRAGNLTGVTFFILTSVMVLWSIPVTIIIMLLSKKPTLALDYLSDATIIQVIQIVVSSVAFIFPFLLLLKMMKARLSDVGSFNKATNKKIMLPLILIGLGVCGFSNFVTSAAGIVLQQFGFDYNVQGLATPTEPFGIVLSFVATAITPALVEEFAMRGVLMGVLRKYGEGFAVIVSALVFGLMHGNLVQIPFAFILGLFFGYAVIKTGTIWTAVIIHFINNFISISFDYIFSDLTDTEAWFLNFFYLLVLVGIGFIGFWLLQKAGGDDFKLDNKTELNKTSKKLKSFLLTPCMIIVYVIVLIESFLVYAV
ncbi:MAG: CPBP family intramembrane metalloprotease [Clostridia bacterium]|nr:CPBP family intramembrane metalloprotease [Clostridia bacterium]